MTLYRLHITDKLTGRVTFQEMELTDAQHAELMASGGTSADVLHVEQPLHVVMTGDGVCFAERHRDCRLP